jgi:hypothetical protein
MLFSLTNLETIGKVPRTIEYIGTATVNRSIFERVYNLEEPSWDRLKVTKQSDIPGIKYNYKFLSNLVRFQLYDRFSELRNSLPGHEIYSGQHYFQSAFGINYEKTLYSLRKLFVDFGGSSANLYKPNSLNWLAKRMSFSKSPENYAMSDLKFCPKLVFSENMVGWIALLLSILKAIKKRTNMETLEVRNLYAKIVLMSLFE